MDRIPNQPLCQLLLVSSSSPFMEDGLELGHILLDPGELSLELARVIKEDVHQASLQLEHCLHVSHRAEHLGVGEPWQEAEDNPQEGSQLHFPTIFWSFSDNFPLFFGLLHATLTGPPSPATCSQ